MVRSAWIIRALALALVSGPIAAQDQSPVYVDDSPTAEQVLAQLPRLVAQGNLGEAASNIQRLLDEEPTRLVADANDPDLFLSVRDRMHASLLASPELLDRYRLTQEPLARRLMDEGEPIVVERSLLMTRAGADAALALAQAHFESARFSAAALTVAQLRTHPDVASDRDLAIRCARLLATIAPYTEGDLARREALAFAELAGIESEITQESMAPVDAPASARLRSVGIADAGPAFTPGQLLARPLRSAPILGSGSVTEATLLRGQRLSGGDARPWIMPVLAGDTVLLSDGLRLTAWDRVTLRRLWQHVVSTPPSATGLELVTPAMLRRISESDITDAVSPAVADGVAVGVLMPPSDRSQLEVPQLHAVAMDTGRLLWVAQPSRLRPEWGDGTFSGPATIVEGQVIAGVFQFSPLRRVMSAHLVALDLYTGELRWSLLSGTAGVAPSQRLQRTAHLIAEREGVVYRTDPIGIISAVEAHSGRPIWTRRVTGEEGLAGSTRDEWEQPAPIVLEDRIVVISPDQLWVYAIDRATGAILGQRPASTLGWPEYLLLAGDRIVCVGTSVMSIEADGLLTEEPVEIESLRAERAPGRVRLAGDELLVPSVEGALLVDPASPEAPVRRVALDYPGAPVGVGDQLVVADNAFVHAYLPWPTAERALRARMNEFPDDPDIALTYAELAYRAGEPDLIPDAAGSALAAIERLGRSEKADQARRRLYESLLSMLTDQEAEDAAPTPRITPKLRERLVDRLGESAASPTERVGHLMEVGKLAEIQRKWDEAAQAYQAILLADELGGSEHVQGRRRQRADLAATAAVRELVRRQPRAYAAFDEQASSMFASLTSGARPGSADDLELLARRYPVARIAPEALLAASDQHLAAGLTDRSIGALERALASMDAIPDRRSPSDTISGEIAGRLVVSLAENDRLFAASQTLQRLREQRPSLKLTDRGSPLDSKVLAEGLSSRLSALARLPRVGQAPSQMAQAFIGWSVLNPMSTGGAVATNHLMLHSPGLGHVALFGIGGEATDQLGFDSELVMGEAPGALRPIWSRPAPTGAVPSLVRLGPAWAMLLWGSGESASIELIDTVTGRTRWQTPAFSELFGEEPARRRTGMVETPLDGPSRLSELIVVIGDHHAALIERTGRTALFDLATGEAVWTQQLDVPVVYEAALGGGVLALVGERPADVRAGDPPGVVPLLATYDVRTRTALSITDDLSSLMRWVRVDRAGRVIVGLDRGVIATDPRTRSVRWLVDDPAVRLSGDAWLLHDRAIVLGPDRQLWQIDTETGTLREAPLEDVGRVGGSSRVRLREGADGEAAFATDRGLVVFARDGSLVGGDATSGLTMVLPPVPGEGVYAMLQTEGRPHQEEGAVYRLWMLGASRGIIQGQADLRLLHDPEDIVLLDGAVVVGAAGATLVYEAPKVPGVTP